MTEYVWASPGGVYVVPEDFREALAEAFPGYRVRWSLRDQNWHIEQPCGRNVLPPIRIDPFDDDLIRAADGFWKVMTTEPGDRRACPAIVERFPLQRCGFEMKVPHLKTVEAVCPNCRYHRRDGRTFAAFFPFTSVLIEHLRSSDPLKGGVRLQRGRSDAHNRALLAEADRKQRDASTIDAVDYRWVSGIASSSGIRRQIDHTTFR